MSWRDRYDVINRMDDDLILFGGHFEDNNLKFFNLNFFLGEDYKDFELDNISHVWIRFGLVWIDDEKRNGYYLLPEKPKSMRGVIKATLLTSKESIERSKKAEEMMKQYGF